MAQTSHPSQHRLKTGKGKVHTLPSGANFNCPLDLLQRKKRCTASYFQATVSPLSDTHSSQEGETLLDYQDIRIEKLLVKRMDSLARQRPNTLYEPHYSLSLGRQAKEISGIIQSFHERLNIFFPESPPSVITYREQTCKVVLNYLGKCLFLF